MDGEVELPSTRGFRDIKCPSGNPSNNVVFFLHWPPRQPGREDFGSLFENMVNVSVWFLAEIFPNFYNAFALDQICKRYGFFKENGKEVLAETICRMEKCFPVYQNYTREIIESLEAITDEPLFVCFGRPNSKLIDTFYPETDEMTVNGRVESLFATSLVQLTHSDTQQ